MGLTILLKVDILPWGKVFILPMPSVVMSTEVCRNANGLVVLGKVELVVSFSKVVLDTIVADHLSMPSFKIVSSTSKG